MRIGAGIGQVCHRGRVVAGAGGRVPAMEGDTAPEPVSDRPHMPDGYGVPETVDGLLPWATVEQALVESLHYWLSTVRPDGRPHVVPRWGVWMRRAFWYDGSPDTIHARNLRVNPEVVLTLESGEHAVILEGSAAPSAPVGGALGQALSERFVAKYGPRGYAPAPDAWSGEGAGGLVVFRPHKALAWFQFPRDVTRFRFGPAPR